ncbi:MAG: N-acetylglucosamine kinase [Flavobacteriaceae bacterium]|nr:N-acetylglucosamine kinase [Flavobacteriaceae bacterium]
MIFIVDSGSTKCDWLAIDYQGNLILDKQHTKGMNPAILSEDELCKRIQSNSILNKHKDEVTHVYFYGAGCGTEKPRLLLKNVLETFFCNANVDVKEDTYAAAYACIGTAHDRGLVCILGTGSNCSYFNGAYIEQRVESLGYSIMDDASGNYFGRQLIRDYYFNYMPENLKIEFENIFNMASDTIKYNLYKQENPNAYLASFAAFMFTHKSSDYIKELIKAGIQLFAKTMIFQYKELLGEMPVHFAGSIAFMSQDQIKEVAKDMGFRIGNFVQRPIDELVAYHISKFK